VLGANIDFKGHELKDKIKPYVVKWVKGRKVGSQPSGVCCACIHAPACIAMSIVLGILPSVEVLAGAAHVTVF
jgi:hypothetical protein